MVAPDPLKIKYREALILAVQAVVRGLHQPFAAVLAQQAQGHASEAARSAFIRMLSDALQPLHEGRRARYRLRRSEYLAWQLAQAQRAVLQMNSKQNGY